MVRSMGHVDRMLYPYDCADVDAGRLTREQAKEPIKFLWIKYHARTRERGEVDGITSKRDGSDQLGLPGGPG